METPAVGSIPMTPEMMNEIRFQKDVDERNRPWVEEELDALFPTEGYEVLQPPASYKVEIYLFQNSLPLHNLHYTHTHTHTHLDTHNIRATLSLSRARSLSPSVSMYM